jgi:hypothetical protein
VREEMGRWLEKLGKLAHMSFCVCSVNKLLELLLFGESNPVWGEFVAFEASWRSKSF